MSDALLSRLAVAVVISLLPPAVLSAADQPGAEAKKLPAPETVTCQQGGRCSLLTLDHLRQNVANHRRNGDVLVLCFWSTSCAPCQKELPEMDRLAREFGPKGVRFYFINQGDEPGEVRDFLSKQSLSLQVVLDAGGKVGTEFGVEAVPAVVVINQKWKHDRPLVGYREGDDKTLKKRLEELLAPRKEEPRQAPNPVKRGQ
jgi:thiol-disulfide isomerase/thioredoxin